MNNKLRIQNSIDYIEIHLCDDIKLAEIARQSYFSEFHFNRLFKKATGTSVMEYVRERRLSEAATELTEANEKITDIALKYQFSSEESFSRAFKKRYGTSPRYYRNIQRETSCCVKENGRILSSTILCMAA